MRFLWRVTSVVVIVCILVTAIMLAVSAGADTNRILTDLRSPNELVRLGAFVNLEKLSSPEKRKILPLLLKMLDTADEPMKDKLLYAICDFGEDAEEAFPSLFKLLKESARENNAYRQFIIIGVMGVIGQSKAAPTIAEFLGSEHIQVHDAAVLALKELGTKAKPALPKLIEMSASTKLCEDVLLIVMRMGMLETEAQAGAIADLLERDGMCSDHAMFALIKVGKHLAIPSLIEKLSSPKKVARLYAVRALGEIIKACNDQRVLVALKEARATEQDLRVLREIEDVLEEFASKSDTVNCDKY